MNGPARTATTTPSATRSQSRRRARPRERGTRYGTDDRRAGATGPLLLRADSGFWSAETFSKLHAAGWQFSIGVRQQPHVRRQIEQIDEHAWSTLDDYPPTSIAQIAETVLGDWRLVIRRVRTLSQQGELLPSWEHFAFATNRTNDLHTVEAEFSTIAARRR